MKAWYPAESRPAAEPPSLDKFPDAAMGSVIRDELIRLWEVFCQLDWYFGHKGFDGIEPLPGDFTPRSDFWPIISMQRIESEAGRALRETADRLLKELATITLTYDEVKQIVAQAREVVDIGRGEIDKLYIQLFRFMNGEVAGRMFSAAAQWEWRPPRASDESVLANIYSTAQQVENAVLRTANKVGELADEIDRITSDRIGPSKQIGEKRELFRELFATTDGTPEGPVAGGLEGIVRESVRRGHNIFFGDVHNDNRIPGVVGDQLVHIADEAGPRRRVFSVEFVHQTEQQLLDRFSTELRAAHNSSAEGARTKRLGTARQELVNYVQRYWGLFTGPPRTHRPDAGDRSTTRLRAASA